jgi:hypothetical protein
MNYWVHWSEEKRRSFMWKPRRRRPAVYSELAILCAFKIRSELEKTDIIMPFFSKKVKLAFFLQERGIEPKDLSEIAPYH